ncbi:leucine--tRNA ligase [Salinarchaeum sp. IM2453]|uniref:leucine--tRNA ligase n=1 Tax=Salinarchaeum sp. IM2453 TaxID=2862870 RepID=UPI001C839663|nr:leucine--tRNA ligase [Salinarchaeum sp. IM2453]QZA89649.1 leucine--tRNA ligase [Salinarchaeum sp. IM2453]
MAHGYDHGRVREYWQYAWERENVYELDEDATDPTYVLGMFPYTSGALHMGHVRNYAITDAYARYRRMQGDDVLHPMGWDAFGLPAENAAFERMTDPESWTRTCIDRMRDEMESMGLGYDWNKEITTCEPEYYRWNQWLFKRLYENDLVEYRAANVNWCPDCETTLADAQVDTDADTNVCWRCGTPVTQRELDQWFFKITEYADELAEGLDDLDGWQEGVRESQRNWIGRQEGTAITFDVPNFGSIEVFSTRVDTIYGATFVAVSPMHDLADKVAAESDTISEQLEQMQTSSRTDDVDAIETSYYARHPLTGEELPVYIASYVLEDVGTGAVMGVPAHNERDHRFALAQDLPIKQVIEPVDGSETNLPQEPYTKDGMVTNSEDYTGLASEAARNRILDYHDEVEPTTTYRLRDWLISRQRYWGTPIPIVHCPDCGHVPIPDEDLPVELPEFIQTTGNPLEENDSFVETTCPECGQQATRETDTMDTFVDSSWYYLRFLSPEYEDGPFDSDRASDWMPIDVYVGGEEHAVLHLLYIRFITKALADMGLLSVREPTEKLISVGTVLYNGEKMSETQGNVIAPHEYGPETTRLFVLSAAHPEQNFEWTAKDIGDAYDFQQMLYNLVVNFSERSEFRDNRMPHDDYLDRALDRAIISVSRNYGQFRFHQVSTELRELAQLLRRYRDYMTPNKDVYERGLQTIAKLVAPIAPHLGEELWNRLRGGGLVVNSDWPTSVRNIDQYDVERSLIQSTLADVREIIDVVNITDLESIDIAVAEDWKYEAHELARTSGRDEAIVGTILDADTITADRERLAEYASELEQSHPGLDRVLPPDREKKILSQAAWLLDDEFDVDISVDQATKNSDLSARANPGKPAIRIN